MTAFSLLSRLERYAEEQPEAPAYLYRGQSLSYGSLWQGAGRLAASLHPLLGQPLPEQSSTAPIAVLGQKGPGMVLSFVAAAILGRPYLPVDSTLPQRRAEEMLTAAGATLVVAVEEPGYPLPLPSVTWGQLEGLLHDPAAPRLSPLPVGDGQPFYILFTSGSTGAPKGVVVTRANVESFLAWAADLLPTGPGQVLLNQAPLSFDLSVFSLHTALYTGARCLDLPSSAMGDMGGLFDLLRQSALTAWVSTPSFVRWCLCDPGFSGALLPRLRTLLFCGETLLPATARTLLERFPKAQVVNSYGPTEATVAVTAVTVTPEHCTTGPLPIGRPKPGVELLLLGGDGTPLPPGESGEMAIVGDSVAGGYCHGEGGFFWLERDGLRQWAYRTGDWGVQRDGLFYFQGRRDRQVKHRGYRIELEEVEAALAALPYVAAAAMTLEEGVGTKLTAHLVLGAPHTAAQIRADLAATLPTYMLPGRVVFWDALPLNPNGKLDRRALGAEKPQ